MFDANPEKLEEILSDALGQPVSIARSDLLMPWSIARCHIAEPAAGHSKSVIAKWLRDDPSGFRIDPQQMRTERAALEFLSELGLSLAPRLIASDLAENLLVLEDLSPRVPLADLLRHDMSASTRTGLSAFAKALGELNSATTGYEAVYYARRGALGPVDPQAERERFLGGEWIETREFVTALGVAMPNAAEIDFASVLEALSEPGPFLAFSNGDAGSNNFLVDGDDGRIIDFEFAGYRHALTDAACLHVPGPMWITVTDPIATGTEDVYRKALSRTVSEASDDRLFGFGMAAGCLAMAMERLHRMPKLNARARGDKSRLQLVSTLESAARAAGAHKSLPHLTGWMRKVAETLRQRWPDTNVDLTAYRAYTFRS